LSAERTGSAVFNDTAGIINIFLNDIAIIHVNNEETQLLSDIKLSEPSPSGLVVSLCAAVWTGSIKGKQKWGAEESVTRIPKSPPKRLKTKYSIGNAKESVQVQCMRSLSIPSTTPFSNLT
jgi:hypothetical protein